MKRKLSKLMALILACVVALGLFASCELIAVNTDKDMEQVVATVKVNEYGKSENIYKRELISGYVNYGYQYVSSYGYTLSKTYDLILDNLANNKVIVQYAKTKMEAANTSATITLTDKNNSIVAKDRIAYIQESVKYLTDVQIAEAQYNARASVNALLDSFDESKEDETKEVEDETITERTIPTAATVDGELVDEEYAESMGWEDKVVEDLTAEEKTAYDAWLKDKFSTYGSVVLNTETVKNSEGENVEYIDYPAIAATASRKKAFDELVELFTAYGLISSEEKGVGAKESVYGTGKYDFTNYTYYLDMLANNVDALIIENYENQLNGEAKEDMDVNGLWDEYVSAYNTQKAKYEKDLSAYESALDAMTEDSFLLYHPNLGEKNKYGFVANILIGFSDEATAALTAFKAKATSNDAIKEYREELLKTLVVKDLRATWLQKGYADVDGTTATFKSDYVKTDKLNTFIGTFEDNSEYKTKKELTYFKTGDAFAWGEKDVDDNVYSFANIVPTEMSFDTFKSNYLSLLGINQMEGNGATVDLDLIDDMLFAFGTDPGSLNNYLGYVYSPSTSATTYVKEFADAAKDLVAEGVGAYKIVATDYGYHVMICTYVVEPTINDEDVIGEAAKEAFVKGINDADVDSVAYKFKKVKETSNLEKIVSDTVTYNIAKYIDKKNGDYAVKTMYKTIKDLIEEADFNSEE